MDTGKTLTRWPVFVDHFIETIRRWVRECRIFPPPVKDGREYLFHESAVKVDLNRPVTGSLLKRIRNGKKAKS
ncbi:excisionase [Escherichia albertii]|uniref:excisionase n=1 Tax=Escherichia albertii TaxID=208962 RepID=UPI003081EE93